MDQVGVNPSKCPFCGGALKEVVELDKDDPDVEWVGYICPKCTPVN